jgi:hypothetical protein
MLLFCFALIIAHFHDPKSVFVELQLQNVFVRKCLFSLSALTISQSIQDGGMHNLD